MTPTPCLAELVAPNLHVALIHYPLALLAAGVLVELFSFLWPRSSFRTAGRWMILLGALSGVPAAFSGIYALRAVARVDLAVEGRTWADVKAASPVLSDPQVWRELTTHTLYQSIATGVAAIAAVAWLGMGDPARRASRLPVLLVLVLSLAGMMVGAWFSGEAIYKHGTGVERGWPATPADTGMPPFSRVEGWFPPVELHLIAAGTTVAIAMAAVGLSFRKLAVTADPFLPVVDDHGSADLARSFNPSLEVAAVPPPMIAGRFWLLAFVVAASTSLGGWWVLTRSASVLETTNHDWAKVPAELWHQVKPDFAHGEKVNRRLAHLVAGGTIILLPLVLAGLSRWAPRRRLPLAVLTLILAGAVAGQVWFGVLLLYDGPLGPINHWQQPSSEAAPLPTPAATQTAT